MQPFKLYFTEFIKITDNKDLQEQIMIIATKHYEADPVNYLVNTEAEVSGEDLFNDLVRKTIKEVPFKSETKRENFKIIQVANFEETNPALLPPLQYELHIKLQSQVYTCLNVFESKEYLVADPVTKQITTIHNSNAFYVMD